MKLLLLLPLLGPVSGEQQPHRLRTWSVLHTSITATGIGAATSTLTLGSSSRCKSWGWCCTVITLSVALGAATAVAAVYGFLLLVLPDNGCHVVMFKYYYL